MARDFVAMLDEILAEHVIDETPAYAVTLDYLSVVDELHSGRINIAADAESAYAALKEKIADAEAEAGRPEPDMPLDPEAIARELGLSGRKQAKDLDHARRDFALRNHPDRVAEHLRQRAMVRMQIANRLIDEAKRGQR